MGDQESQPLWTQEQGRVLQGLGIIPFDPYKCENDFWDLRRGTDAFDQALGARVEAGKLYEIYGERYYTSLRRQRRLHLPIQKCTSTSRINEDWWFESPRKQLRTCFKLHWVPLRMLHRPLVLLINPIVSVLQYIIIIYFMREASCIPFWWTELQGITLYSQAFISAEGPHQRIQIDSTPAFVS